MSAAVHSVHPHPEKLQAVRPDPVHTECHSDISPEAVCYPQHRFRPELQPLQRLLRLNLLHLNLLCPKCYPLYLMQTPHYPQFPVVHQILLHHLN